MLQYVPEGNENNKNLFVEGSGSHNVSTEHMCGHCSYRIMFQVIIYFVGDYNRDLIY